MLLMNDTRKGRFHCISAYQHTKRQIKCATRKRANLLFLGSPGNLPGARNLLFRLTLLTSNPLLIALCYAEGFCNLLMKVSGLLRRYIQNIKKGEKTPNQMRIEDLGRQSRVVWVDMLFFSFLTIRPTKVFYYGWSSQKSQIKLF